MGGRLILAVVTAGAVLAMAPPAMAESVECVGQLGGPLPNVTVPEGADCRLRNAQVQGNVEVREDGGLIVEGSQITGNVRGAGAEYWGFMDDRDQCDP